jgi:hypothetical protein
MTLGAVFAWGWLPSLQEAPRPATRTCEIPTLPNKTLETLAKGRAHATGPKEYYPPGHKWEGRWKSGGEVLTFKGKLGEISGRVKRRWNGGFAPRGGGEEGEGGVGEGAEMREMNGAVVNGGGHGMA